jgi:hypothetical protein
MQLKPLETPINIKIKRGKDYKMELKKNKQTIKFKQRIFNKKKEMIDNNVMYDNNHTYIYITVNEDGFSFTLFRHVFQIPVYDFLAYIFSKCKNII